MMSVDVCEVLVELLLGGYDLNYVGHSTCIWKASNRPSKAI